jgi:predicted phosphoadenosine phosphosulfate sulfurtransferase
MSEVKADSKKRRYIDQNVYDAALERINYVLDTFDSIWVSFSGGKDSLAVLKLVEEVYDQRGITRPINVIFRDEEVIQDDVIDYVNTFRTNPRYNFKYYAVQQHSIKFVLGQVGTYIQWDPSRPWIRPKPDYAITDPLDRVHSQNSMDSFLFQGVKGKIAFLMGIRADESLVRLQSVTNKRYDNYITSSDGNPNVKVVKPIYDWTEKDIFRYFFEKGIDYCHTYDTQMLAGHSLRVATPLVAESAKRFGNIRIMYPKFYEQIISIWPEMLLQERYYKDLDRDAIFYKYPPTWDGIMQYIDENIPDAGQRKKFKGYVTACRKIREKKIKEGSSNLGGYPILHVFKAVVSGTKQMIQAKVTITKKDLEYEGL